MSASDWTSRPLHMRQPRILEMSGAYRLMTRRHIPIRMESWRRM